MTQIQAIQICEICGSLSWPFLGSLVVQNAFLHAALAMEAKEQGVGSMNEATVAAEPDVIVRPKSPQFKRRSKEQEKSRPKTQPPYAVIVENDDLHTWNYVIEVLQKVFGYDEQKAYLLTAEVHYTGQAIVWSGALELAELKRDQIRGFGPDVHAMQPVTFPLGVRVEKLPG